jgi:hypothetical protein
VAGHLFDRPRALGTSRPRPSILSGVIDPLDRLRAWTRQRQRLGTADGPLAVLDAVVGVYSSHPTAPLALAARAAGLDGPAFADLEARRQAVRVPGMRGSIFLVPTELAGRVWGVSERRLEKYARTLEYAGLDWEGYARIKARVLKLAGQPIATADLQQAIPIEGRLMTAVRLMAHEGLILRLGGAALRSDGLRYVATEAWLGQPLDPGDPAESLAWLADRYLRGYGPARARDFAWWAGVTLGRARAALAATGAVDLGQELMLPADLRDAYERPEPSDPDAIDLLPKWDAYTMGLAPDGRQRFVDPDWQARVYSQGGGGTLPGDGFPVVLRGGRAVATWSHRFRGDRMLVAVSPFEELPRGLDEAAFAGVGRVLGASAVELTISA